MPFLRFTRDKRGYEQFSLVDTATNRRGKSRSRLLYWYRTPPNVRVGREPFDESVRRALEAQYPGVQFDWRKIVETPIPSAETDRWRERRRVEKAEKAALRAAPIDGEAQAESDAEAETEGDTDVDEAPDAVEADGALVAGNESARPAVETAAPAEQAAQTAGEAGNRRRRRRRGGRGRPDGAPQPAAAHSAPLASESQSASESDSAVQSDLASDSVSDSDSDPVRTSEPDGE